MNLPTPQLGRRSAILLTTLFIIIGAFAYYFLIYIKKNEARFIDRGYRVLDRKSENLKNGYEGYKSYLDFVLYSIKNEITKTESDNGHGLGVGDAFLINLQQRVDSLEKSMTIVDSTSQPKLMTKIRKNRVKMEEVSKNVHDLESRVEEKVINSVESLLSNQAFQQTRLNELFTPGYHYVANEFNDHKDRLFGWMISKDDGSYASFSVAANDFLSKHLTTDFFDEFVLIKENNYDDEYKKLDKPEYSIFYQSFKNELSEASLATAIDSSTILDPHSIIKPIDVFLYNTGYKLLSHRFKLNDQSYYLAGFVYQSTFKKESQKVETFLVVISFLIILLLLISMPILKLVFMSSIERLHIRNVTLIGVSIIMGIPVVLLTLFCIYDFVYLENIERDNKLQELSNGIEKEFESEIEKALNLLANFDQQAVNDMSGLKNVSIEEYPTFNQVFWMNEEGYPKLQFNLLEVVGDTISLKERNYFKQVASNKLWTFKSKTKPDKDYDCYLESIISWNNYSNEVAISIPSKFRDKEKAEQFPVVAITSELGSVLNTILPTGYGYAIINKSGDVKFHSENDRVLQENFLKECEKTADIVSSMFARSTVHTSIKYRNENYRAYVQPINEMPLFLVTFYNNEFRNVEVMGVVSLSIILLFGTFAAVGLMILILYLVNKKRSKLRIQNFLFSWLKPVEDKCTEYQVLFVVFLLIGTFILLMILMGMDKVQMLFTLVITNAYLFLVSYYRIAPKRHENRRANRNFYFAILLFIVAANLIIRPGFWIIYQIVLVFILLYSDPIINWVKKRKKSSLRIKGVIIDFHQFSLKYSYNLFLFSWLVISSILPIFYIFMIAHNEEKIIWEKYSQLDIAKQYQHRIKHLNRQLGSIIDDENIREVFFNTKKEQGEYLLGTSLSHKKDPSFEQLCGNSKGDTILNEIRPNLNGLITESKGLAFNTSNEYSRVWCYSDRDKSMMELSFKGHLRASNEGENIYVKSNLDLLKFGRFHLEEGADAKLVFWVIIFVLFIGIYVLIDFVTNKIYGREYSSFKNPLPISFENFNRISKEKDIYYSQKQILLLGLPKSNKTSLLESLKIKPYHIDLISMNDQKEWGKVIDSDFEQYESVIIENFEYGVNSHGDNKNRLKLLEKLVQSNIELLIVSSNVHPSFITSFYEDKQGITSDTLNEEYQHALEVWRNILGGFVILHNPIKENEQSLAHLDEIDDVRIKNLLKKELNRGSFLPTLIPALTDYYQKAIKFNKGKSTYINNEDIILRIQMLAESYYLGLWNTLSKEERYIIYDLAKDRFVNINNKNGIRNLLEKGLLVYDDELRILNDSFTNFVLSIIKKEEALKMEQEVREKGTWSTISSVLGLFVLGIVAFLFLGNPDFFDDFNAIISVIVAVAGLLPRLGGLVSIKRYGSVID